jgi:hypothetical protein
MAAENRCGTPARVADNPDVERAALIQEAFRLEEPLHARARARAR